MEMTLHQPGRHEPSAGIDAFTFARNAALDCRDASIGHCDVDCCARVIPFRQPRIAHDKTEGHVGTSSMRVKIVSLREFYRVGSVEGRRTVVGPRAPVSCRSGTGWRVELWSSLLAR